MNDHHHDFLFYADETCISNNRYMALGGLILANPDLHSVRATIQEWRDRHKLYGEVKWQKISRAKLDAYQELIEIFFALNSADKVHFKSLVVDTHSWLDKVYHNGNRELALDKLYYNLILHKHVKHFGPKGSCFACLDERSSKHSLNDLRDMVNQKANSQYNIGGNPLKEVISRSSKDEDIIQLNDVVLGALGAVANGKHLLAGTSEPKKLIAQETLNRSGARTFSSSTRLGAKRFEIWHFQPKGK